MCMWYFALTKTTNQDTLLYYLDADNIIHPNLYNLLEYINSNTICAFHQHTRITGDNMNIGYIDTAMVIIPFNVWKKIKWKSNIFKADGYCIKECIDNNRDEHVHIDNDLYYYNFLQ